MILTAEEKQIIAMYDEGSVKGTLDRLTGVYLDICNCGDDPLMENTVLSAMEKLSGIEASEYRRLMRDSERPVGIWYQLKSLKK